MELDWTARDLILVHECRTGVVFFFTHDTKSENTCTPFSTDFLFATPAKINHSRIMFAKFAMMTFCGSLRQRL